MRRTAPNSVSLGPILGCARLLRDGHFFDSDRCSGSLLQRRADGSENISVVLEAFPISAMMDLAPALF
jgi:hypothetical protein